MKGFKIKSLTTKGDEALADQVKQQEAQPPHARLLMGRIFKMEKGEGFLTMHIRNAFVASTIQSADFILKIVEGFEEKDCFRDVDYTVEVF